MEILKFQIGKVKELIKFFYRKAWEIYREKPDNLFRIGEVTGWVHVCKEIAYALGMRELTREGYKLSNYYRSLASKLMKNQKVG